ncbi:hypothetical protein [Streptomyces sp. NRRL S-118]|uniref:hypothetical protein n=1 Tax=Streptomyces sp. NRRL S-118 TaxID=1463881 RepID=UPI000ABF1F0D|nr:hypothetical protein [Streptomyces sp. NRRL S-118]
MRVNGNPFVMLAAFAADWPRLSRLLDPEARSALSGLLAELRAAGTGDADRAVRAVRTVLEALPDDEAARLRRHGDGGRFTGTASPAALYQGWSAADLCLLVVDGNPMVGPVLGPVRDRLLSAPALPWTGAGAADPRLIVLSAPDGGRRLPAFQFEAGTMPWAVVLEVNTVLRAGADPWGAADWWLSAHTWWNGTPPAGLLGRGRDDELLAAARALAGTEDPDGPDGPDGGW